MKALALLVATTIGFNVGNSQTGTTPPPGTPAQNPNYGYGNGTASNGRNNGYGNPAPGAPNGYQYQNNSSYPAAGNVQGGISFSNRNGQSFTVNQLADQLRNLQSLVEQTLPAVTAFNESFVTGQTGSSSPGIGGAISNLISGVLQRNGSQSAQSSPALTNLLAALHGQNGYSAQNPPVTQNTPRDLTTLQDDLNRLTQAFQSLGLSSSGTPAPTQVISSPANRYGNGYQTNQVPYSPTGR